MVYDACMSSKPSLAKQRPPDEKVTINLGVIDLGRIDLLVQEGFYSNRTDFIRTGIRDLLSTHAGEVAQISASKTLILGTQHFAAKDLEGLQQAGQKVDIRALGLVTFDADVTVKLAQATINSISVLGALHASPALKAALLQLHP